MNVKQIYQLTPMMLPHAHLTIMLYTELNTESDHQTTFVSHLKAIGHVHHHC